MGNNKPNKGELIFIILMFVIINGTALYFISSFWDVKFTVLAIIFLSFFVIIDIVKRVRNYLILKKMREMEEKRAEEIRKKQEEYERIKEERRQLAIARQRARTEAMKKGSNRKRR